MLMYFFVTYIVQYKRNLLEKLILLEYNCIFTFEEVHSSETCQAETMLS